MRRSSVKGHWTRIARRGLVLPLALLVGLSLVASAEGATLDGTVKSGSKPIERAPVTLLKTTVGGTGPVAIGEARTNRKGRFSINYGTPGRANSVLYAISGVPGTNRSRSVRLATVLGTAPYLDRVRLNERTTVAAAFAEAQFISGWRIHGPAPGPQNGTLMAHNLADPANGRLDEVITGSPNGAMTPALDTFNSLANTLTPCVRNESRCSGLLAATTPSGRRRTNSILKAFANVARNPGNSVNRLYKLSQRGPQPYGPALTDSEKPNNWSLFVSFWGDGQSLDGPGNIAFDADGNAWVGNNYMYSPAPNLNVPAEAVCGGNVIMKFQPDGSYAPGSPYTGGGASGTGYGILIDLEDNIWISNFGFAAPPPGCSVDDQPPHNSLSQYAPDGTALSPDDTGWTQGEMSWPQGMAVNSRGDIWVANCGPYNSPLDDSIPHDSLTVYPESDPNQAYSIRDSNVNNPFDVAFNKRNQAFISGQLSDNVIMYNRDGTPTAKSPITGGGLKNPMGVAADRAGNIWVSNSQLIELPCPDEDDINFKEPKAGSVTLISKKGEVLSPDTGYTGGGTNLTWGMAIDGNDNVWTSNFGGQRVSSFCGVRERRCGKGLQTGDPISPNAGYAFPGLVRNTAVEVDPTGNVWITNNWKQKPFQTNPGGYTMVVMLGAAGPVETPLIGQPKPLR